MVQKVKITLSDALDIDGQQITEVELREPNGHMLGRHTLIDLAQGEVRPLADVVPKVSTPMITGKMVRDMAASELMVLADGFGTFFDRVSSRGATLVETAATTPTSPARSTSPSQKAD